jgi:hypothetical protein
VAAVFPWNWFGETKDFFQGMNPEQFQKIFDQWMKMTLPNNLWNFSNGQPPAPEGAKTPEESPDRGLNERVFETLEDIYIQIPLENKQLLRRARIYYTQNQCFIEGLNKGRHVIPLPALVRKKGARAAFRDQMLEIKIPKNTDVQISEIPIRKEDGR